MQVAGAGAGAGAGACSDNEAAANASWAVAVAVAVTVAGSGSDDGGEVSPVTLSAEWPRLGRLVLLVCLAVIGCVGNVFMISAVMIEDFLKKTANSIVVNVALADLLVTGLVIPASAIVLLAGQGDLLNVCKGQWFFAALCFLVTVLSLAITSAENYFRLCGSPECYSLITPKRTTALIIIVWCVSSLTSGLQFVYEISFDYCTRKYKGLIPYQATVGIVFVFLPILITFLCYFKAMFQVRRMRKRPNFKPPITFNWDYALMISNFYSFITFVIFWLPFGVILSVGSVKNVPDRLFYNLAWFALSKSCVNNFVYCVTNRHFRNAYVNLFHYCCCKTTVSFSRRHRGGESPRPLGDVRVHIIPGYNMYSYTSPQRAPCRDSYEL